MKNKLKIQIGGTTASGKSVVAYIIKGALKKAGLKNIEFDGGIDFDSEGQFDKHTRKYIFDKIEALNDKDTEIEINEVQFNRPYNEENEKDNNSR